MKIWIRFSLILFNLLYFWPWSRQIRRIRRLTVSMFISMWMQWIASVWESLNQTPWTSAALFHMISSQVTYVTMVPRVGNETLRPLGVATGNALSVTRSEDTYEKTPPVGRRQPMTSLPAYHNISAAGRIHHQLLRLKLASEAWLKAQGTQCLVPHSGNHGYIRNLRRSPSWELELRPLGVATGNVIPTSPCWGECKPIWQKRRALSQLYPA